jgi:predicted DNA-binding transcriptional regulator AlpA
MSIKEVHVTQCAREMLFENGIERLPKYLTSLELAQVLGVSVHTIRAWRKFRIITPSIFGRSVRWLLSDVLEELSSRRCRNEKS